jgi:uncharacterized protein
MTIQKNINIIIKTVERCNLNCSYCYFFNGLDQSYIKHPKFISKDTINNIAVFIQKGIEDLGINEVSIGLHGGEPLMQPKEEFIYLIETLQNSLKDTNLYFTLQTNATLVTEKWIDLLSTYKVLVGVSFDGPEEYHNKYRLDHNGIGSYDRVIRGIQLLQEKLEKKPGCLTVVNPEIHGAKFYRYLIGLGFTQLDLLLPDFTHNNLPPYPISRYAKFIIEVFDEWMKDNKASISIRKLKSIILQLLGENSLIYGFGHINPKSLPILSIRSNGDISPTDELMSTDPETVTLTGLNVSNNSMKETMNHPIFYEINRAYQIIPDKCSRCCWYNACGGGGLVNRFSNVNRFNNPSIYCDALQEIFTHTAAYLINSGISEKLINKHLIKNKKYKPKKLPC